MKLLHRGNWGFIWLESFMFSIDWEQMNKPVYYWVEGYPVGYIE